MIKAIVLTATLMSSISTPHTNVVDFRDEIISVQFVRPAGIHLMNHMFKETEKLEWCS